MNKNNTTELQDKTRTFHDKDFEMFSDITEMLVNTDLPQNAFAAAEEALMKEVEDTLSFIEKEDNFKIEKETRDTYKRFLALKLVDALKSEMASSYEFFNKEKFCS